LNEKFSEVKFKFKSTKDKLASDADGLVWHILTENPLNSYAIDKETNLVAIIQTVCTPDGMQYPNLYGELLHGVKCGDSGESLFSKYGEKNIRVLCFVEEAKGAKIGRAHV
jgi:hypothetical protein